MFTEYENLIKRFHQALMQKNLEVLRNLLADNAKVNLDQGLHNLEQLDLPLSDDIEVTGIELEGSGDVITIYYINRLADQEYSMLAYLRRSGESIKLDYPLPQLQHIDS